jgi:hypothetical protein
MTRTWNGNAVVTFSVRVNGRAEFRNEKERSYPWRD